MNFVIKKNGTKEDFDIAKIRKQIEPACKGTNINSLELESQVVIDTSHNLKSSDIQENLILTAKNNIDMDNPDWDLVAGRLMSHQVSREVWKNTKLEVTEFPEHMDYLIRNNYYRSDLKNMYTDEEVQEISKCINPKRDYDLKLSQIMLLKSKYLIKHKGGTLEYPSTADLVNSMILASGEQNKIKYSQKYYDVLSKYYVSLATPFKSNLRLPNGNTGSCFIGETVDSLYGLFKAYTDMAVISKEGGGIGYYMGKVRPGDTYTPGVPKSNKINKWVKIINDIAVAVNQKGIRKGAITPALDWWHLDIVDFCEIKSELSGDLRDKCFDIFPQVVVDNFFIERIKAKLPVYQYNQYEFKKLTGIDITELTGEKLYNAHLKAEELINTGKLKHFNEVKANELWKKFLWVWIEYGDFYISHKDNINISNYVSDFGVAKCVNLCVESFSISKPATKWKTEGTSDSLITTESDGITHSCNLLSINVANILNNDKLLREVCSLSVRMLDASIDMGIMPVLEAKTSSELLRNIGIGVVGMADWMAHNKLLYDTQEGKDEAEKLSEKIAWYCYNASIELAVEKGSYPGIKYANYDKLFGKTPEELTKLSKNGFNWVQLRNNILEKGIRNFYILSYAPNTSSALVQGVIASYLPAHSKDNTQTLGDMIVPVLPKFIKERYWYYKTKFQYRPEDLIKFTQVIQRWIDTGISMEVPINPELTDIKKISDAILDGFISGELKAVYYSLTIDTKSKGCTDCAN